MELPREETKKEKRLARAVPPRETNGAVIPLSEKIGQGKEEEEDVGEIDAIRYTVFSSEEVLRRSVCEIDSLKYTGEGSVYDERMGGYDMTQICLTCGKSNLLCMGHFGHIALALPVIHPLYAKKVLQYLKCFCRICSNLLLPREVLALIHVKDPLLRAAAIVDKCEKLKKCYKCYERKVAELLEERKRKEDGEEEEEEEELTVQEVKRLKEKVLSEDQPRYIISKEKEFVAIWTKKKVSTRLVISPVTIYKMFQKIDPEDMRCFFVDPTKVQPKFFIITALPVIPVHCRPFIQAEGATYDDDLSKKYIEIVKANQRIRRIINPPPPSEGSLFWAKRRRAAVLPPEEVMSEEGEMLSPDLKKAYFFLAQHIHVLIDNTSMKVKCTNKRPFKSLKHRIYGKEGRVRGQLLGKRCNFTGRTVAGPDPTLSTHEIAIPESYAGVLTVPETVNAINYQQLSEAVFAGKASFLMKKNGIKINLEYALFRRDLHLPVTERLRVQRNDVLFRGGGKFIIDDPSAYVWQKGDKVMKNKFFFTIEWGDIVERHLRDGDPVILNRQPTLHRGSMFAFRARLRPGSTIRTNLAITTSYNLDFDGRAPPKGAKLC